MRQETFVKLLQLDGLIGELPDESFSRHRRQDYRDMLTDLNNDLRRTN